MTFRQALRLLPGCVQAGFDPLTHTTVADLRFLVQHEIDLHEEGDIQLTKYQLLMAQKFLTRTAGGAR